MAVVASEASRAVEEGMGSIGVAQDLDAGLDEMERAFPDLQFEPVEGDAQRTFSVSGKQRYISRYITC